MKIISITLILLLSVGLITSCKNKKDLSKEMSIEKISTEEINALEKKMLSQGMKKALVINYSSTDAECGFLIKLENENLLQPLNIKEDLKKDQQAVWINYTPSRRQQGPCKTGTPITINKIETRIIKP